MSSGRLILVRHGESTGNIARRFSPDPDIELTERGVEQARETGRMLRARFGVTQVVASPYHRARRTAELIAEELGGDLSIQTEDALRERAIGEFAGARYGAMREHPDYDPAKYWAWRPPGGESLEDVRDRAGGVLEALAARWPDEDVLLVSHGGTMLALCAHVEGAFLRPRVAGNCQAVVIEHESGEALRLVEDGRAAADGDASG